MISVANEYVRLTISSVAAPRQVVHPYHTERHSVRAGRHAVNCSAMLCGTNSIRESIQEIIDYCKYAAHWPARTALLQFF
jgi:hypothetical protein